MIRSGMEFELPRTMHIKIVRLVNSALFLANARESRNPTTIVIIDTTTEKNRGIHHSWDDAFPSLSFSVSSIAMKIKAGKNILYTPGKRC